MNKFTTQEEFLNTFKIVEDKSRLPLTGQEFDIDDEFSDEKYTIDVLKDIGFGPRSIIYEVYAKNSNDTSQRMLMKEFYPSANEGIGVGKRDDDSPVKLSFDLDGENKMKKFKRNQNRFINSYDKHCRIHSYDIDMHDKVVRPIKLIRNDDSMLALFDSEGYQSIDRYIILDLNRIINILIQTSDILACFHDNEIIYMDLKPANILYDYKNERVKLFDLDAAVFLEDLESVTDFFMPNEKALTPPEFRKLSDINNRKYLFITEEVDLYMLGVMLFYMIMDRYPYESETENLDYLEKNVRDKLDDRAKQNTISNEACDKIVELLKESLAIFRFLSVNEFKNKLIEIEKLID